jgi:hypothetical protein
VIRRQRAAIEKVKEDNLALKRELETTASKARSRDAAFVQPVWLTRQCCAGGLGAAKPSDAAGNRAAS